MDGAFQQMAHFFMCSWALGKEECQEEFISSARAGNCALVHFFGPHVPKFFGVQVVALFSHFLD